MQLVFIILSLLCKKYMKNLGGGGRHDSFKIKNLKKEDRGFFFFFASVNTNAKYSILRM